MHTIFTTQSTPPRATFIDCIVCLSVNDLSSLSSPYFFFFFFFPTISQPAVFHSYYRYISLYWLCQRCSPTDVLLSIETDRDAWVERGRSSFLDPNCRFFSSRSFQFQPILRSEKSRAMARLVFEERVSNRTTSNFRGMQMALVEFLWR